MEKNENRPCPKCKIIMAFQSTDGLYICIDPNCGYTEYVEDEDTAENDEFRCPHCGKVIDDDELPI